MNFILQAIKGLGLRPAIKGLGLRPAINGLGLRPAIKGLGLRPAINAQWSGFEASIDSLQQEVVVNCSGSLLWFAAGQGDAAGEAATQWGGH